MARKFLGINTGCIGACGLVLSMVIALVGALIAQQAMQMFRGIGVISYPVSLIIGEVLFKSLTLAERLVTIVVGSISYQFLVWGVILGFNTSEAANENETKTAVPSCHGMAEPVNYN